jgi:putative transposase
MQSASLNEMLADFCDLYNAALQQRIEAWSRQRKHLSSVTQTYEIKSLRVTDPDIARWSCSALHQVLHRLEQAYFSFFRNRKGFPRFRSAERYRSADFRVGNGLTIKQDGRVGIIGIPGSIKVRWHRDLPHRPKSAIIVRQAGKWYVIFHVEEPPAGVRDDFTPVGLDLGLNAIAAFSDGRTVERPGFTKAAAKKQRRLQRALARKRRLSSGWRRTKMDLARHSAAVTRRRRDFAHKLARQIVTSHSHVAVEKLNIKGLAGGVLAKHVNDAAWGMLLGLMREKAESAACVIKAVDPRGTSQECPECGVVKAKALSERTHRCGCGCVLDRDVAAAKIILRRAGFQGPGAGLVALSQPVAAGLAAEAASL